MEIKAIGSLSNFELVSENDYVSLRGLVLTHVVSDVTSSLYDVEGFVKTIGLLNTARLLENPVIFLHGDSSFVSDSANRQIVNARVHSYMETIISSLWFIKDNACSVIDYYAQMPDKLTSTNRMDIMYTNASGEFRPTQFTSEELGKADEVVSKILDIRTLKPALKRVQPEGMTPGMWVDEMGLVPYNEYERISRSLYFLHHARSTSFLPLKISFYIAILECLFTTDRNEVTHKVTEAATFYLGGDYQTKLQNFELIKDAYGIRSAYLHGQSLSSRHNSREALIQISMKVNEIIRVILLKAFDDKQVFSLKSEQLNSWLKDMILGKPKAEA